MKAVDAGDKNLKVLRSEQMRKLKRFDEDEGDKRMSTRGCEE